MRVLVIGGGVVGVSLSRRLAEGGAAVTLVEAGMPGAGTSATSFGWVNASSKLDYDPAYFELNRLAVEEHHRLAAGASWWHPTGNLELGDAAVLEAKVARLRALGYRAELAAGARLSELEPGLRRACAAHFADEGWADVGTMVASLVEQARASGVELRLHQPVGELISAGDGVTGARLQGGEELIADVVVLAVGRRTPGLLAPLGADAPLVDPDADGSRAVGLLATVVPAGAGPRRMLQSAAVNWAPQPGGRVLLASEAADSAIAGDRSSGATAAAAGELVARAGELHRALAGAELETVRVGLRVLPIDDHAICGWAGGVYVVATHSGVTLAPLLARLVAGELLDGAPAPLLERFRPARFVAR